MSRPATAAHSSSRTHSVESRASLRRSVSATLAGIWAGWCHEPCARSSRISSLTKNGLPPLRCHSCGGDLGRKASSRPAPGPAPRRRPGRGRPGRVAGPARRSCAAPGTPRCPGRRRAGPRARAARARARNPSSRSDGSSAQCRSSSTTSTGRPAARRPQAPRRPPRTSGTGHPRGGGAHRFGRPGGGLQQPARLAEVGHRQAAGLQHLRPGPVRRRAVALPAEPAQDEGSRPGLADQRGQHRRLADAGLAADHQELPGAAAGIVEHRAGGGQHRLPADEPVGSTHGFIMAGQGRSSKTRFIGAGTSSLRTRLNPASAASARSRCSPARPERLGRRGRLLGYRVRRAGQGRDGVEHAPGRVEVVLDVVGPQRLDQEHRSGRRQRLPGPGQRAEGIADVVQGVEEGDQVIALAGQAGRGRDLEPHVADAARGRPRRGQWAIEASW